MAFSVTSIGTVQATGAGTVTIGSVTVPAGACILVGLQDNTNATNTVSDGTNGSYTSITSQTAQGGKSSIWHFDNSASLSGATISVTVNARAAVTACYVTGCSTTPIDSAVTAGTNGNSTTPSVTSGTPGQSGELFVGFTMVFGQPPTFTEPSGWVTPPVASTFTGGTGGGVWGGNIVNAGSSTKVFNPTLGGAGSQWYDYVIGLKPLASNPFAKYDWPLSILAVLNPPGFVQSIDLPALAGAGAKPFAKYDWPGTLLPPPDRSFIQSIYISQLANAGNKPFAKYDWPLSVLAVLNPPGFVQPIDLSALAGAGAQPFAKYDWPGTQLPPPDRSYWYTINLSALQAAYPFNKYDWPLSVQPVLNPPGFVQSVDLSALANAGAQPFAKYDWPLSVLPPPDRSYVQPVNVSALFVAFPFAKYDWPLSVQPVLNPPGFVQSVDLSALANAGAQPFAKYDWQGTQLPPPDRSYWQSVDLSTLSVALPFAKYDWPISVLPALAPPGFIQSTDLSALANAGAKPFAKYDWPLSVSAVLNPPGYWQSPDLPLYFPPAHLPFAKYDWPLTQQVTPLPAGYVWSTSGPLIPVPFGTGKRKPLFLTIQGGIPASYWPDGNG